MGVGKPRGIKSGRKLKIKRQSNKWADKHYNVMNIPSRWKKPFESASHAKGIVLEKLAVEAK
jgi:small subunit ribosomal protein S23e